MSKPFNFVVFIGRFQPAHKAHIETIEKAFEKANNVILLIGSADQARTIENPFHWREREEMIRSAVRIPPGSSLECAPTRDCYGDQRWTVDAQKQVQTIVDANWSAISDAPVIGLIGHNKDAKTSRYLKMFPQWKRVDMPNIDDLHASNIREMLWNDADFDSQIGQQLPGAIHDYLKAFTHSKEFEELRDEYHFNEHYKKSVQTSLYEIIFNTADAIVVQSGHVLLIRRRALPGKGLWALPGGFLNPSERVEDCALRELKEETRIDCPLPVLRGSIKSSHLFDTPGRSLRGRIITHAYLIELPPGPLHKVKGSDDADKAKWVPLNVIKQMEDQMFEDHFQILDFFLG